MASKVLHVCGSPQVVLRQRTRCSFEPVPDMEIHGCFQKRQDKSPRFFGLKQQAAHHVASTICKRDFSHSSDCWHFRLSGLVSIKLSLHLSQALINSSQDHTPLPQAASLQRLSSKHNSSDKQYVFLPTSRQACTLLAPRCPQ